MKIRSTVSVLKKQAHFQLYIMIRRLVDCQNDNCKLKTALEIDTVKIDRESVFSVVFFLLFFSAFKFSLSALFLWATNKFYCLCVLFLMRV